MRGRQALAARVTERVAKRKKEPPAQAVTPTPAPVAVETLTTPSRHAPSSARARQGGVPWAVFLLLGVLVCFALRSGLEGVPLSMPSKADMMSLVESGTRVSGASLLDRLMREPPAPAEAEPAVRLRREGHVSLPGGILVLPESFKPGADGAFDLLLHFHGNTAVVRESAEVADLNAAVAIINLGIGSAPYEEYYAVPGTYEELLETIRVGVERRGVASARLRRVALSGWSAGYGAVSTILTVRRKQDQLDAVLIFDGIHCGWENGELNHRQMRPFALAAEQAVRAEILFGITHSDIDPKAYASTMATASYLLAHTGAERAPLDPGKDAPAYLELASMRGAVSKKLEKRMEPTSEARKGRFHVLGYRGDTKEHHMAHLFQMGATLLPELAARWRD